MTARFFRLSELDRVPVNIVVDGIPVVARRDDTLLVAMLSATDRVRMSEFGDGPRSGFCLMGACQDCWVWTAEGGRLRACTTVIAEGMSVSTQQPEEPWLNLA